MQTLHGHVKLLERSNEALNVKEQYIIFISNVYLHVPFCGPDAS